MPSQSLRPRAEYAHLLLMDLVGYSRLSHSQQARQIERLRQAVSSAPEFRRAQATGDLLCLDLGDGMALIFVHDPTAPARCALDIAAALAPLPDLKLRMGIHSGLISRREDITDKENVHGEGINLAQRVMDCGDAGHILLSRVSAEILLRLDEWQECLHPLGECEVKHGEKCSSTACTPTKWGTRSRPRACAARKPRRWVPLPHP